MEGGSCRPETLTLEGLSRLMPTCCCSATTTPFFVVCFRFLQSLGSLSLPLSVCKLLMDSTDHNGHHSNSKKQKAQAVDSDKHRHKSKTSHVTGHRIKTIKHKSKHRDISTSRPTKGAFKIIAYPTASAGRNGNLSSIYITSSRPISAVLLPAAPTSIPSGSNNVLSGATTMSAIENQHATQQSASSTTLIPSAIPTLSDTASANVDLLAPLLAAVGAVAAFAVLIMLCFTFCRSTTTTTTTAGGGRRRRNNQRDGKDHLRGWGVRQSWLSSYSGSSAVERTASSTPSTLPPPYDELKIAAENAAANRPSTPTTTKSMQYTPMLAYSPSCMSQQSWYMPPPPPPTRDPKQ